MSIHIKNNYQSESGQLSLQVLIFSAIAMVILSAFLLWADANLKTVYRQADRSLSFAIAEAGIDYYRWHLAHAPNDFQDGTGQPGPYIHDYQDKNGSLLGQFVLDITAPPAGSSMVTVKSTGKVSWNAQADRAIEARWAMPSVIQYALIANNNLRVETGTEIFGPVHANGGMRFDGLSHNLVTSARSTYNDPDHSGADEYGVHTHLAPVDPLPPSPLPSRPDIFEAGRDLPVPFIDFSSLTESLAIIKSKAQSAGRYWGPSGARGYHLVLKTNGTFDLYKVKKLLKRPDKTCKNSLKQKQWGTWSIKAANGEQLIGNFSYPANGLLFLEDHLWINGSINTARLTVASGRFPVNPKTYTHITVNQDLTYTNYDGQDALGLIAQGNINIGMDSEDDLRIDAAAVAQNGRVGRYYYKPTDGIKPYCSPYHSRTKLVFNGMIATNQNYGFAYTDGSGYQDREIIYDANLLYNPPPSFPLISDEYQQIFWNEVK